MALQITSLIKALRNATQLHICRTEPRISVGRPMQRSATLNNRPCLYESRHSLAAAQNLKWHLLGATEGKPHEAVTRTSEFKMARLAKSAVQYGAFVTPAQKETQRHWQYLWLLCFRHYDNQTLQPGNIALRHYSSYSFCRPTHVALCTHRPTVACQLHTNSDLIQN
jgi:hypothetical protein